MRTAAIAVVAVGLLGLTGTVRGADDNKDLIVGTWEIVYSDAKEIPAGAKLEFTKAGKVNMTVKVDGKDKTAEVGVYKVEKDIFTLTGKESNKTDKANIVLLNKSSLIFNDMVEDKVTVLKKMKAK
jgi:uncharacterized protein (TIGR03066 family)